MVEFAQKCREASHAPGGRAALRAGRVSAGARARRVRDVRVDVREPDAQERDVRASADVRLQAVRDAHHTARASGPRNTYTTPYDIHILVHVSSCLCDIKVKVAVNAHFMP